MTTAPPPAMPPPQPPGNVPGSPAPATAATAPDPTPVLSAIGQINMSTWGDDRTQLIRLQAIAVGWNFQWFALAAIAAAMPWVLGRPGVVWSTVLMVVLFTDAFMQSRFRRKHGVVLKVAITKANRRQALIRIVVWESLVLAWILGIVAAMDSDYLLFATIVALVALAFVVVVLVRRSRQHAAAQPNASTPPNFPPPSDGATPG